MRDVPFDDTACIDQDATEVGDEVRHDSVWTSTKETQIARQKIWVKIPSVAIFIDCPDFDEDLFYLSLALLARSRLSQFVITGGLGKTIKYAKAINHGVHLLYC